MTFLSVGGTNWVDDSDFLQSLHCYIFKSNKREYKHDLLLDQSDFLVHFMDIARDELDKSPNEISVEKLQSLLDLALRSTSGTCKIGPARRAGRALNHMITSSRK
ncbi:hypothetical protein L2E82_06596 [Cichorium intybus]|uniref:Uncharacterized protein n=1 Tax=Cichorium intybus TaxID=13427 RepID=A0ACB9HBL2_CICIN|nr:hypothetical protein L2E82_06596 [Cichorium intybus]